MEQSRHRIEKLTHHLKAPLLSPAACSSKDADSASHKLPRFAQLTELGTNAVGSKIVFATDEWFASADNLMKTSEPEFIVGKFTPYGKWMDGWESRRKRVAGHDWCVVQLGLPGLVQGVMVDTRHFTGNYALRVSVQAACITGTKDDERAAAVQELMSSRESVETIGTAASETQWAAARRLQSDTWTEIVSFTEMGAGVEGTSKNYIAVDPRHARQQWTHLRLNMFPDGGVARFHVYGNVRPSWPAAKSELVDLAAATNGGSAVAYSDAHYGRAANLIAPGRASNMGEGWETARKPDRPPIIRPSAANTRWQDWVVLALGARGTVERLLIDTNHFKGNFPQACDIVAIDRPDLLASQEHTDVFADGGRSADLKWKPLLPRTAMRAHAEIDFKAQAIGPVTHVRVTIYPDGGISRLRLFGRRV